jgi:DNA ligase D-like protein (predicted 3'-phosphoesterase)
VFVVQQHAATARHFDLRLEVDGVMRSWAVPKGPSLDPAVKRLAVEVADHAMEHNAFEGPLGAGGGVIVWDRGTYEQGGRVPWPQALTRGHAVFVLHGEKLRGGFVRATVLSMSETLRLTIVYEDGGDGWIVASIPEVPGAHSQGHDRAEARENVIDALHGILELRFGEHALSEPVSDGEPLRLTIAA